MAVKKTSTTTKQRLASGIHQVASKAKAKDVTPVPTKTRRFEKAKTTLTPFIRQEDRGDDQVEMVDVSAAIQSKVSEKTLRDLGVSTAKIKEAKQAVEEVEDTPVSQTQSLAVPTPTVQPAPEPGETLTVDKDITKAAKEMRFAATQIVGQTGFLGSADISLANKAVALDTVVKDVERGNLTNAEARDRVAQIKDQPPSGPLSDALYVVPGYGTFLSYQDARNSGWSPVETGFFAVSAASDILLFFSPIKKAGGAVTRVAANTPKKVVGQLPFTKANKAFADSTVVTPNQQAIWNRGLIAAGKLRVGSDPAFGTGRPRVVTATVEAPTSTTIGERGLRFTLDEIDPITPDYRTGTIKRLNNAGEIVDELYVIIEDRGRTLTFDMVRPTTEAQGAVGLVSRPKGSVLVSPSEVAAFKQTLKNAFPEAKTAEGIISSPESRRIGQTRIFELPKNVTETPTRTRPVRTDPGPVRTEPGPPRTTPRPDRLDPAEAPTVKPRRKTDEPLPKPGPLDDPLVIPSPTPVPDQPPPEEAERVFEFQPDPDAVQVQTTPTPEERTEIRSEPRTETAESGTTGTEVTTTFPGTRYEGFPRDFPFPPGQAPDQITETETPSKTKPKTKTKTKTTPAEFTEPFTETGGGQAQPKPTPTPKSKQITEPFTEPGEGPAQPKPRTTPGPKPITDLSTGLEDKPAKQPEPKRQPKRDDPELIKTRTRGLPSFELPKGKRLPKGFFPKTVTWPQGTVQITYDLTTGTTTYKGRTPDKKSPRDGFRVTQITRTPPPPRVLDMGVTDALVTTGSIRFRKSKTYRKDRTFKRSRGRL